MARKRSCSQYLASYAKPQPREEGKVSRVRVLLIFTLAALVTLAAGVVLEESSIAIADRVGLSGVLFGLTGLAAATSLPEVATGLASVKIGYFTLAFCSIFGVYPFFPI